MLKRQQPRTPSLTKTGTIAAAIVVVAFATLFRIPSALAWTHLENRFDDTNGADYACGTQAYPCLYWAEPNGGSSTQHACVTNALENSLPGGYNFKPAIQLAMDEWNAAPALNPYLIITVDNVSLPSCGQVPIVYFAGVMPNGWYGATSNGWNNAANPVNGQYYGIMNEAQVEFNVNVTYNNSFVWGPQNADGRVVAVHETGHVEGLGHTHHLPAIMAPNPSTGQHYYTLQADDIAGIQAIYTGTIPA